MRVFSWDDITQESFDFAKQGFEHAKEGSALTIGAFDGPHIGHRALFDTVLSKKKMVRGIVTFARSPRAHKLTDMFEGDVSTLRLRLESFKDFGFDYAVVIDFSQKFGKIEGSIFLSILLKSLSMQFVSVGSGFRCGNNLDTGTEELAAFASMHGIQCTCMNLVTNSDSIVSSTMIRQAIVQGNLQKAQKLLGFSYRIDVSMIEQVKTEIGFDCAKSAINQIIPPVGQYRVCIQAENTKTSETVRCAGTVIVEEGNLRCLIPPLEKDLLVQTIIFVDPEGKK